MDAATIDLEKENTDTDVMACDDRAVSSRRMLRVDDDDDDGGGWGELEDDCFNSKCSLSSDNNHVNQVRFSDCGHS